MFQNQPEFYDPENPTASAHHKNNHIRAYHKIKKNCNKQNNRRIQLKKYFPFLLMLTVAVSGIKLLERHSKNIYETTSPSYMLNKSIQVKANALYISKNHQILLNILIQNINKQSTPVHLKNLYYHILDQKRHAIKKGSVLLKKEDKDLKYLQSKEFISIANSISFKSNAHFMNIYFEQKRQPLTIEIAHLSGQ